MKTNETVSGTMHWTVDLAVYGSVDRPVSDDAVSDAVRGAVSDAVRGAVGDVVGDAERGDPPHPALNRFLADVGAEAP